ncbi:hypothetical protein FKG94_01475 [Exilibacterium tricleocarpae]|uniref:PhoP regulatory network protein YrbL n=1 Tax=Exilibacterium tricleocarpae TaxID=2591008 RepID=A0A545U9U3_9GAMM|nr:YrbL family protein [Exilibacterium tricleocarpae]TQV86247.1 hypothetical protein FKG94_01475 [Exilibacterium tricleocarpae]
METTLLMKGCRLSRFKPLAAGAEKLVYPHPQSPDLLIKVQNSAAPLPPRALISRLQRLSRYRTFLHEITEHIAIREHGSGKQYHLQHIVGFIDTDMGLGMVVRAVRDRQGNLAPTLRQLCMTGRYTALHNNALVMLIDSVLNSNVIVRDFSTSNLVWDERHDRFVIIDGVGAKSVFSLRNYSKRYNRHTNFRKAKKLRKRVSWLLREAGYKNINSHRGDTSES